MSPNRLCRLHVLFPDDCCHPIVCAGDKSCFLMIVVTQSSVQVTCPVSLQFFYVHTVYHNSTTSMLPNRSRIPLFLYYEACLLITSYEVCLLITSYEACLLITSYEVCLLITSYEVCLLITSYEARLLITSYEACRLITCFS